MVELLQNVLVLLIITIMNNKKSVDNNTASIFIGLFSVVMFIGFACFCVFAYFKWIKGKKLFKNKYTNY